MDNTIYSKIDEINNSLDFHGKRVLEIGCGKGEMLKIIADKHKPEYIIGIDSMLSAWWKTGESEGANWRVKDGNAEALGFDDNSFDVIFSLATFEHINNIGKALSEIKRVLKPYGKFWTSTIPIWTSVIGHHFVAPEDETWNPEHLSLIPPWGHLYMTENEMKEHLDSQNVNHILSEQITNFIYHSNIINRISRTELINHIIDSGMIIRNFRERINFNRNFYFNFANKQSELTSEILKKLQKTKYKASDLGVIGFNVVLEKYANIIKRGSAI